jgi:hypothetical protein
MIKTIYILWYQGFKNAPDLVNKCVDSWKYYNPDWTIILLEDSNYHQYANINKYFDITKKNISLNHLSDIIRLLILEKHGGIWADATSFCNKSLTEWLPKYISGCFFAFDKPFPNLIINTWWLYSEKNSYIIKKWCELTIKYWNTSTRDKVHTYFIHNYLFQDLYKNDTKFKEIWDKVPKISGIGARYLFEMGFFNKINDKIKESITSKITPVYKLTYKCDNCDVKHVDHYDKTLILHYLYSTIIKSYTGKRILLNN